MALVVSLNNPKPVYGGFISIKTPRSGHRIPVLMNLDPNNPQDEEVNNLGVKAALSMLRFYKREISPLLPNSCRYVPTCSEYSMTAYKKYGVVQGTILTAWRVCRCDPLDMLIIFSSFFLLQPFSLFVFRELGGKFFSFLLIGYLIEMVKYA